MNSTMAQVARVYIERGWKPVPIPHESKAPVIHGWQTLRMTPAMIPTHFPGHPKNIGVLLGEPSGIVDVDLDCEESLKLADVYLPETPAVFGRASKPRSHRIYRVTNPQPMKRHTLANGNVAVEYRSTGGQTVFPPSRHPSGEQIQWDIEGDPAPVDGIELAAAVERLADAVRQARGEKIPTIGVEQSGAINGAVDRVARCRKYLEKLPPAVSGQGGHNQTMQAACDCYRFDLADGEAWALLTEYNTRCVPPWSEKELRHKLDDARKTVTADGELGVRNRSLPASTAATTARPRPAPDNAAHVDEPWGEPMALPTGLPPVQGFDCSLLPTPFRPWIEDITERMQCPPDYAAVAAMIAAASLIGRKIGIRPKRQDDWLVIPNLWGVAIGRPGVMKTPAMQEPLRPLKRLEMDAAKANAEALADFKASAILTVEQKKVDAERIRKAIKEGHDAKAIAAGMVAGDESPPSRKRYMVNDSTVEKLGEILAVNPAGVLVYRDELVAFLRSLEREGHESARGFYLEAWNGDGRFTYDRIGRGTLDIEACCLSIIGAIQPGPLQEYLRGAATGGTGDDGLMQRFQLAVWPDVSTDWINVDRWPDSDARTTAWNVFARLDALTADTVDAKRDDLDVDGVPFLHFTTDAQAAFDEWRSRLELAIRGGTEHPAIEAHLSKYRKLIPALALIIHLIEDGTGGVNADALAKAIKWGVYLESHARRIYAAVTDSANVSALALAKRILAGDVRDGFTLRDFYLKGWSGLSNPKDAAAAADVLTGLGWLMADSKQTTGRPRTEYRINPAILARKTQNSPDPVPTKPSKGTSVGSVGATSEHSQFNGGIDDGREVGEI
jgi:putative DNA primase/helicase